MLKKPSEGNNKQKNINSFQKFSELKNTGKKKSVNDFDGELEEDAFGDNDLPANPNLPNEGLDIQSKKTAVTKKPKVHSTNDVKPEQEQTEINELNKVEMIGKVAKFPKKVKASKAYNFLENVKISKNSIWYIMVEKMDNELQMVKYNHKKGVDLGQFVNELKTFYITKYGKVNKALPKLLEDMMVDGNDKYSTIKNIPLVELGGRKLITIITEDLIKLLSK